MLENVRFLILMKPLHHAGKNFGEKIDPKMVPGLILTHDTEKHTFNITHNQRTGVIPEWSVLVWELESAQATSQEVVNEHKTSDAKKFAGAQVSTPQGHVFEGPGKGRTKS